jgi:Uma2 family endonuclease
MIVPSPYPATLDDLARVEGKAELIAGKVVHFMPSGDLPSTVALEITVSLHAYAKAAGRGRAYGDNAGFALPHPLTNGRQSFSPDSAYFTSPARPNRMSSLEGVPVFAIEVRSECDYGPAADREMAEKRSDYFEAGTEVVWDVDPLAETIACYRANTPQSPVIFRRGDTADAEPAVPGWRLSVDALFDASNESR